MTPTLRELADIGAGAAVMTMRNAVAWNLSIRHIPYRNDASYNADETARQAFALAVKDAVEKPLLERIQELESKLIVATLPTPPTADGKTPGQVLYEHFNATAATWGDIAPWYKEDHDKAASAVLAAFGQASLEAGIKRMESVPVEELSRIWRLISSGQHQDLNAVRARLIDAAREGQPSSQPAEIPWIEWKGGECPLKDEDVEKWEYRFRDGFTYDHASPPSAYKESWKHSLGQDDITAYRVTQWREGQPAAVDWQARAEKAEADLTVKTEQWETQRVSLERLFQKLNAMEDFPASQLRPISEAGPVPEGCVRYFFYYSEQNKTWFTDYCESCDVTHFADIRLPSQAHAVESVPTTFEAHGQKWTKHTPGDPMPCDGGELVEALLRSESEADYSPAQHYGTSWDWSTFDNDLEIIGWRYADKPKAEPTPEEPLNVDPWQPAVGDVVRLKSGGPEMVVCDPEENGELWCSWFFDGKLFSQDFPAACLMPAEEAQP